MSVAADRWRPDPIYSLKQFFLIPVRFFQNATPLTYASLAVAAAIGILYYKIMFRSPDGAADFDYQWSKWKVIAFIGICVLTYLAAYDRLPIWFPSVFR